MKFDWLTATDLWIWLATGGWDGGLSRVSHHQGICLVLIITNLTMSKQSPSPLKHSTSTWKDGHAPMNTIHKNRHPFFLKFGVNLQKIDEEFETICIVVYTLHHSLFYWTLQQCSLPIYHNLQKACICRQRNSTYFKWVFHNKSSRQKVPINFCQHSLVHDQSQR